MTRVHLASDHSITGLLCATELGMESTGQLGEVTCKKCLRLIDEMRTPGRSARDDLAAICRKYLTKIDPTYRYADPYYLADAIIDAGWVSNDVLRSRTDAVRSEIGYRLDLLADEVGVDHAAATHAEQVRIEHTYRHAAHLAREGASC